MRTHMDGKRLICVGWSNDGAGRQGSAWLGAEKLEKGGQNEGIHENREILRHCDLQR